MAFKLDTDYRDLPSSGELTEIAVSGFDYALRYTTNSYDMHPFSEEVSTTVERRNSQDQVEVLFPEEQYDEILETVSRQLEADERKRKERFS